MCNRCYKLYPRPVQEIVPEPSESVRQAILAALDETERGDGTQAAGWAALALAEGAEAGSDE